MGGKRAARTHITGWRSIRRYAGTTTDEIREAIVSGELRCRVKVQRVDLDAWVRMRQLEATLAAIRDQAVKLVS